MSSTYSLSTTPSRPKYTDFSGYGSVIVLCGFMLYLIADGIAYNLGLINSAWLVEFKQSETATSWIGSIFYSVPLLSAPITAQFIENFGCRQVTVSFGLISTCGFVLSSFCTSVQQLYLTVGLVSGFGNSATYIVGILSAERWFERRRSLAIGIVSAGTGFGTFMIAPVTQRLLDAYGWRQTMHFLASLNILMCFVGFLIKDPKWVCEEMKKKRSRTGCECILGTWRRKTSFEAQKRSSSCDKVQYCDGSARDDKSESIKVRKNVDFDEKRKTTVLAGKNENDDFEEDFESKSGVILGTGSLEDASVQIQSKNVSNKTKMGGKSEQNINVNKNDFELKNTSNNLDASRNETNYGHNCSLFTIYRTNNPQNPVNSNVNKEKLNENKMDNFQQKNEDFLPKSAPTDSTDTQHSQNSQYSSLGDDKLTPNGDTCAEKNNSDFKSNFNHFNHEIDENLTRNPVNNTKNIECSVKIVENQEIHKKTDRIRTISCQPKNDTENSKISRQNSTKSAAKPPNNATKPSPLIKIPNCLKFKLKIVKKIFTHFSNRNFSLLAVSTFAIFALYSIPMYFIVELLRDFDYTESECATYLSVIGISLLVGMVTLGYIGDVSGHHVKYVNAVCILVCGISEALLPVCAVNRVSFGICCVTFGFSFASAYVLIPKMTELVVGAGEFATAIGLNFSVQGLALLIGIPFASTIYEAIGSWSITFHICGTIIASGSIFAYLTDVKGSHQDDCGKS